jgi:hypothetical protein
MMLDEVSDALRHGNKEEALARLVALRECCEKHPGGHDRRTQTRGH